MTKAAALLALALLFLPAPAAAGPARLVLLFTNDVQGYIEPCG